MKILVDPSTNTIHGAYEEPLSFDISGHYVIDIPSQIGAVTPGNDPSVSDLITQKVNAWVAYFNQPPLSGAGTPIFDELIASPNIDTANSLGIETGPNKRTLAYPGGAVVTNPISISAGIHSVCLHYFGFILYRAVVDPSNPTSPTPGPSRMLYSYNPALGQFETFKNSNFAVSICQASPAENVSNVNNNAGAIRVFTSSPHGLVTGNLVTIFGVVGVPGANGTFQVTVNTSTSFTLNGTTFSGGYTSGGVIWNVIVQPTPDSIVPTPSTTFPASFRMIFVNTTTQPYHLSDWILVHD